MCNKKKINRNLNTGHILKLSNNVRETQYTMVMPTMSNVKIVFGSDWTAEKNTAKI